jgi:hypothetical protein
MAIDAWIELQCEQNGAESIPVVAVVEKGV